MTAGVAAMTKPPAVAGAGSELCRILGLDGGGAKGFYTLGILRELEALTGRPVVAEIRFSA